MASDNGITGNKGIKRKHCGDEGKRLTPFQRLAAARQAEKATKLSRPESEPIEKAAISDDAANSEKQTVHSPGKKDGFYRRLYDTELDFRVLAERDKAFAACLDGKRHLDFADPALVMQLTKTLLEQDFGVQIELPADRLCPPVPNRHNYILWLKSLLDSTSPSYADAYEPERHVSGLDVGTGASAIYPLLGCTQRPSWSFVATDIDDKSFHFASKNVELNELGSRIRLLMRRPSDSLIPLDELGLAKVDFVMTNPPFYTSESELLELAKQKSQPPNTACTGARNEMVCDGGEIGFITRILDESLQLRDRVQWYTSMLGKQSSLETIVGLLKEKSIENYAITEFVQGNRTRRWAVGWSLGTRRPSLEACRGFEPVAGKKLLPSLTAFTVASKSVKKGQGEQLENVFWTQLENVTEGLDLVSCDMDEGRSRMIGFADENVWSRAYRRGKERRASSRQNPSHRTKKAVADCAFGFSISVQTLQVDDQDQVNVVVRWLQGIDYGLFESFFGMLRNVLKVVA